MKTSVIIPAYNEERNIGRLLSALPSDLVVPIVAVNGSIDKTAEIARSFGCRVFDIEQQGKLPAIQYVLRSIGKQALEPFLLTDADVVPIFPRNWVNTMSKYIDPRLDRPSVVGGPIWWTKNDKVNVGTLELNARSAYRMLRMYKEILKGSIAGKPGLQYGPNQGFYLHNLDTLDKVLALEHFWPGEDAALAKTIVDNDGVFTQTLNPESIVLSPVSVVYTPIVERFKYGLSPADLEKSFADSRQNSFNTYVANGAPGSRPFDRNI